MTNSIKEMMKNVKLYALTLIFLCCAFYSCSPVHSRKHLIANGTFADEVYDDQAVKWSLYDDGVMEVYGRGDINMNKCKIDSILVNNNLQPFYSTDYYESYRYHELGPIISYLTNQVEKIVIVSDSIRRIYNLFNGEYTCKTLKEVQISKSVHYVSESFNDCPELVKVSAPNLKQIKGAFNDCPKLTKIKSFNLHELDDISKAFINTQIYIPTIIKGDTIVNFAKDYEGEYTIPRHITMINDNAFAYCTKLTEITFTQPTLEIGYNVFENCTQLKKVNNFPELLAPYEDRGEDRYRNRMCYTFKNCENLEEITLPNSNYEWLLWGTFEGCKKLRQVNITGYARFLNTFEGCTSLQTFHMPPSKYHCEDEGIFIDCTMLEEVILHDSTERIGPNWFRGCTKLSKIVIPQKVKKIGNFAFNGCTNLSNLVIPDGVEEIEDFAFANCTKLSSIVMPNSVKYLGSYAFENCGTLRKIKISNSITQIPYACFRGCTMLNEVNLPNNLKTIDDDAFKNCSISTIYIPVSVKKLENNAFENNPIKTIYCKQLLQLVGNNGIYSPFAGCNEIHDVYCDGANNPRKIYRFNYKGVILQSLPDEFFREGVIFHPF